MKGNKIYRVLRIRLRKLTKKQYLLLERLTYHAKNVWNNALYGLKNGLLPNDIKSLIGKLYRYARSTESGQMLYSKCVNEIVKQLAAAFKKHKGHHKIYYAPHDAHRTVIWSGQNIRREAAVIMLPLSQRFCQYYQIDERYLRFKLPSNFNYHISEVHLVPRHNARWFEVWVVYKISEPTQSYQGEHVMGIDLGVDNFATVAISDGTAVIIDGREAKARNQWYNKERARLQSIYAKQGIRNGQKLITLIRKRNYWIWNFIHQVATFIVKLALKHGVNRIAIGKNKNWKHETNLGRQNNQNLTMIPHSRFISILQHKAQLNGIEVQIVDESYTSLVDALALESITRHEQYLGKRKYRGLFISSTGYAINADVNAAINIARKGFGDDPWKQLFESRPESWRKSSRIGSRGCLAQPVRIRGTEIPKLLTNLSG